MKHIKIKLNANNLAQCSLKKAIVIPCGVELVFDSIMYNLDCMELVVTIRNAMQNEIKQYSVKNDEHKVDISDSIKEGELEVEISAHVNGEVTKTWRIPNIIVKQIKCKFELIPELESIKSELRDTKKAIRELVDQLKTNNIL